MRGTCSKATLYYSSDVNRHNILIPNYDTEPGPNSPTESRTVQSAVGARKSRNKSTNIFEYTREKSGSHQFNRNPSANKTMDRLVTGRSGKLGFSPKVGNYLDSGKKRRTRELNKILGEAFSEVTYLDQKHDMPNVNCSYGWNQKDFGAVLYKPKTEQKVETLFLKGFIQKKSKMRTMIDQARSNDFVIKKQKKKLFENGKGFDKYINNTFHLENSMIDCKPVKFMSFSIPMPPRKNSKNLLA